MAEPETLFAVVEKALVVVYVGCLCISVLEPVTKQMRGKVQCGMIMWRTLKAMRIAVKRPNAGA